MKKSFYLYAFLALGLSVFAVQAHSTENQLDLTYYGKRFKEDASAYRLVTGRQSCVLKSDMYGDYRGNGGMQTSAFQSFGKEMSQSKRDCNKYGVGDKPIQNAPELISIYAMISGQFAATNLDVFERMKLGKNAAVFAYPEGEAHTDQSYVLNLEARIQLPKLLEQQKIETQLIGFVETAAMTENRNTWVDSLNPHALTGAGIGFNFTYMNNFEAKIYFAWKTGNDMAVSARDASSRIWVQAMKYF